MQAERARCPRDVAALAPQRLKSGKTILAWAVEGDADPDSLRSNTFSMEWPPRSGRQQEFPEVDRAAWFSADEARKRINAGQMGFVEELVTRRRGGRGGE